MSNWEKSPHSEHIPFDNDGTDLLSTETGPAIRELAETVGASASPGFQFGRSGNLANNTWLNVVGSVPSNRAGITVALSNPVITNVYVASEDADTYDVAIYEHEGDETNLTLLGSVSIVASRSEVFTVLISVTEGRQLACRITNGSAKNCNVGLQLQGSV
jgi:hypothetical protein